MKRGATDHAPVFVVDDDELLRWSAAERLRECGYRVEVAANALEALQRCPSAAAALLNHDHPRVDGLALADSLRRHCPGCAVVLMTADLTPDLRRRAQTMGIAGVLKKPFSLEDLVDAIRDALARSRPASSHAAGSDGGEDGAQETSAPRGV